MRNTIHMLTRSLRFKAYKKSEKKRDNRQKELFVRTHGTALDTETLAIIMVVQPGETEWQSVLLACSLKTYVQTPFKLYTYCQADTINQLNPFTTRFFNQHFQSISLLPKPFYRAEHFGHKIYACAEPRVEKTSLYLDSNYIMAGPKDIFEAKVPNGVSVVQSRISKWTNDRDIWKYTYEAAGLSEANIRLPSRHRAPLYPFFDAGVILYDSHDFGKTWKYLALDMGYNRKVPKINLYRDEITLPMAIQKSGMAMAILDKEWNGSYNYHVTAKRDIVFTQYHNALSVIVKGYEPVASAVISKMTELESFEGLLREYHASGTPIYKPGLNKKLANENIDPFDYLHDEKYRTKPDEDNQESQS